MANGFGLGGFGEGLTRGFGAGTAFGNQLAERSFRQQEIRERRAERQAAAEAKAQQEARKLFREDVQTITQLVDTAAERSPVAAERVVEQLLTPNSRGMSQIDVLAARAGQLGIDLSSEMISRDLQARVAGAITPEETAQAGIAQEAARFRAIEEGVLPPAERILTPEELQERGIPAGTVATITPEGAINIEQAPIQPQAQSLVTFQMPDGSFRSINSRDVGGINKTLREGGVNVPLSVAAESVGGLGTTTATQTGIEQQIVDTSSDLANLERIEQSFDTSALEIPTRVKQAFLEGKEKLGFDLTPEETAGLQKHTDIKQAAITNVNELLNRLSGAAVSPAEAERIRSSLPDPGTGIFDGDSETVFSRKLKNALQRSRMALAKLNWARREGLDALSIPTDNMREIIQREGERIQKELKDQFPEANDERINKEVREQLRAIFGI